MDQPYPVSARDRIDQAALDEMQWVQDVIGAVRNIRGEMNIEPGKALPVLLQDAGERDRDHLDGNRRYLTRFGRFKAIDLIDGSDPPAGAATALVGAMKVLVPLGDVIDVDAEAKRLTRERDKARQDCDRARAKLNNPNFVEKAPPQVVEKERRRLADMELALTKLDDQIERIRAL